MKPLLILSLIFFILYSCNPFRNKNTLIQAIDELPLGLDPAVNYSIDDKQIYSQIYESLLCLDQDYKTLVPNLAQSWQNSPGNDTISIHLKNNVYFHDGSKVSSYSVQKSVAWLKASSELNEFSEQIKDVVIEDSLNFRFILNQPSAVFTYYLASPQGLMVMSEKALKKYGSKIGKHPVGTGPFRFKSWENHDEIHLEKFEKYRGTRSKVQEIIFKFYSGPEEMENALSKNKVDIIYAVSAYSIDRLQWLGKIEYHTQLPLSVFFIGFKNQTYPFDDIRVRQAVLHALNIPKLVFNVNRGNAEIAKGPLSSTYQLNGNMEQSGYNLELARELLKNAGIEHEISVNFDFPLIAFTRQTLVEILESELSKIGIRLNSHLYKTWDEYDRAVAGDSAQIFVNGGAPEVIGDPVGFLYDLFHSKSKFNTLEYHNAKVDQWLTDAKTETDPVKRNILYKKTIRQILNDTPAVFLYHFIPHFAYNSEKIKKMVTNPYGIIEYNNIELN